MCVWDGEDHNRPCQPHDRVAKGDGLVAATSNIFTSMDRRKKTARWGPFIRREISAIQWRKSMTCSDPSRKNATAAGELLSGGQRQQVAVVRAADWTPPKNF